MTYPGDVSRYLCSVIVPVYNGSATVEHCLDALAQQSIDPAHYEIILIDDGSTDNTQQVIAQWCQRHPHIQCQQGSQPNQGPAAARNRGAKLAQSPLLLFTDADCRPSATWIETFYQRFAQDESISAAMGAYASVQSTPAAQFAQLEFEERYIHMRQQPALDLVATYSAAFRRNVFLQEQGFDPAFPKANNEDVEFSYRLSQQGYRMVFVPAAVVTHPHAPTWWGYASTKFSRAYWRTVVYKRYPTKAIKDSYTPQTLKLQIVLAPLALLGLLWTLSQRRWAGLGLCAPFLLTTIPMVRFAARQRAGIAVWVPWGLWLRSLVFALGVGWALVTSQPAQKMVRSQAGAASGDTTR